MWLAHDGGSPVAVAAHVEGGRGPIPRHSLAWLLVSPTSRRRGFGRALVGAVLAHARQRGAAEVWVETHADWAGAIAFWNAVGFEPWPAGGGR